VLNIIVNVIDRKMEIGDAVAAPRIHHQWWPDRASPERGLRAEVIEGLERRGHKVEQTGPRTAANSIMVTPQGPVGAADQRTRGSLAAGH
jgi:gamma-glutamyltranspeptidase/glutathione hydrolase